LSAPARLNPVPVTSLSSPAFASAKLALPPASETSSPAIAPERWRLAMVAASVPSYILFSAVKLPVTCERRDVGARRRDRGEAVVALVRAGEGEAAAGDGLVVADVLVGEARAAGGEGDVVASDRAASERRVIVAAVVRRRPCPPR
jgi:hypothetical protein